jgi:hypothetical protein
MNMKKNLQNRIKGWFPQEPYGISTRFKADYQKKQPPLIIPPQYNVSATKVAGAFAVFWIILYGFLLSFTINLEVYPVSAFQVTAWIITGSAWGVISCAILIRNQLSRLSKEYQFSTNIQDIVLVMVPTVLFFVVSSTLSWSTMLVSLYALGVFIQITRCVMFVNFERKENMRLMQGWWEAKIFLVPEAPKNQDSHLLSCD